MLTIRYFSYIILKLTIQTLLVSQNYFEGSRYTTTENNHSPPLLHTRAPTTLRNRIHRNRLQFTSLSLSETFSWFLKTSYEKAIFSCSLLAPRKHINQLSSSCYLTEEFFSRRVEWWRPRKTGGFQDQTK